MKSFNFQKFKIYSIILYLKDIFIRNLIDQKKYFSLYLELTTYVSRKQIIQLTLATFVSRILEFTSIGLIITILFNSNKFFNNITALEKNNTYIICLLVIFLSLRTFINGNLAVAKQDLRYFLTDKLRNDFLSKIAQSSPKDLEKVGRSELKNLIMGDIGRSIIALDQGILTLQSLINFVIYFSGFFYFSSEFKEPFIIGFICTILAFFSRKSLSWEIGNLTSLMNNSLQKTVGDFINGLKNIKANSSEEWFLKRFKNETKEIRHLSRERLKRDIYFDSIRDFLIAFLVGIWFLNFSKNIDLVILTTILVMAYKTSSSVSSILKSYRFLINALPAYLNLKKMNYKLSKNSIKNNNNSNSIKLLNKLKLDYPKEIKWYNPKIYLNSEINLILKKNNLIALVGQSGSGKTTILDSFCGLINKETSKYEIKLDKSNYKFNGYDGNFLLKKFIGYCTQETFLFEGTILENLFLRNHYNLQKEININLVNKTLESLFLSDIVKRNGGLDYKLNLSSSALSGGEIKRLGLARTILQDKLVEVYDEPTAYLDNFNSQKISNLIKYRSKRKLIIVATHDENLINSADKIIKINYSI